MSSNIGFSFELEYFFTANLSFIFILLCSFLSGIPPYMLTFCICHPLDLVVSFLPTATEFIHIAISFCCYTLSDFSIMLLPVTFYSLTKRSKIFMFSCLSHHCLGCFLPFLQEQAMTTHVMSTVLSLAC